MRFPAGRCAAASLSAAPLFAWSHGFGERYDLPAPLDYFVAGAALTVALSFVVVALAVRGSPATVARAGAAISLGPLLPVLRRELRAVSVLLLALVIVAGLAGDPHPAKNFAPTFVWIAWWVGMSMACAGLGNLWAALDPWRAIHEFTGARSLGKRWPPVLGGWPAVFFLLAFAWVEVVYPGASHPATIALFALGWSAITLTGMAVFGREAWQRNADVFALYFATLARFSAIVPGEDGRSVRLRWPGAGLLGDDRATNAMVAFVLAMLATVLFDGLLGTQHWRAIDTAMRLWVPGLVDREGYFLGTLGLACVWVAFLVAYLGTCFITSAGLGDATTGKVARLFAMTLVPIAIAYLFAHYFSYLLVQGQGLFPLLSDPLGRGWNLFGTATWTPNIGLIDARVTWYVAIGAIVAGHVIAVWLAHRKALGAFGSRKRAILASIPITVLMVAYTAVSLSIIAEPLVRFSTPDASYSCNKAAPSPEEKA